MRIVSLFLINMSSIGISNADHFVLFQQLRYTPYYHKQETYRKISIKTKNLNSFSEF